MAYIFLDESGDLGFDFSKPRTSKHFLITFLFARNKKPVEKIVKKIFRSFSIKELKHHPSVLHAHFENKKTIKKVLSLLSKQDISILCVYLNKKKIYTTQKEEKPVLYNIIANILLDRVYSQKLIPLDKTVHLVASRRETNEFLNQNFKDYLIKSVAEKHNLEIKVEIKTSHGEKCLQIVDFTSWAIFRKYEYADVSYYNIIKNKIAEENPLYPL